MRNQSLLGSPGTPLLLVAVLALLALARTSSAIEFADPTRPTYLNSDGEAQQESVRNKYRLNSILVGEHRKLAIINGQRVREGDRVGDARVSRINQSSVTLLIQGATVTIALSAHDIKSQ